jgi:Fur family ferric uptake transcriptional regulator
LNILCRVMLDGGSLHYRVSTRGHHHHLVCSDCGRVEDFTKCDVGPLVSELAKAMNYEIAGHWLEVYGRCHACSLLHEPAAAATH